MDVAKAVAVDATEEVARTVLVHRKLQKKDFAVHWARMYLISGRKHLPIR